MAKDLEYYLTQARRIAEHREAGSEKEIRKLYKQMLNDLQTFVSEAYVKYAKDDQLTFALLQKAGYDARFLEEIEKRINVATPKATKELQRLVEETYKMTYDGMIDGVLKGGDLEETFADALAITPEQIRKVVKNPIMEVALQKNHRDIVYDIKQAVAVGLMNGDRYTTMARRISEKVDGAFYKSVRIARTEAHRVREAGNNDASVAVDQELQNGTTGMRMCKTWKTMKDERVRPQQRRRGKKGWSTKMGKGANHMKLDGQTVLANEDFDLLDGNKAPAPGSSGVAGHDINCRCYVSYEMMTDEEFFKKTGRHFPEVGTSAPMPKIEWGSIPEDEAVSYAETLNMLTEMYPLKNKPLDWVGDFRIINGYDLKDDYYDFIYANPKWDGLGAMFVPSSTVHGKPYIQIVKQDVAVGSAESYLKDLAEIRKKYGWRNRQDSFYNLGGNTGSVLTHEYGHALAYDCGLYGGRDDAKEVWEIFESYTAEEIGKQLSIYATTHPNEMVAEAFVQSFDPEHQSEISKRIMALLKKARGDSI